jgi:hypothetical protein
MSSILQECLDLSLSRYRFMAKPGHSYVPSLQLRALLEHRCRQLTVGVTDLIRDVSDRSDGSRPTNGQDGIDDEHRDDFDLALLQMRGETLARIDAAQPRRSKGYTNHPVQ